VQVKLRCEKYLIDFLTVDNFHQISEQADLYNAERLREYCNWFYRRHALQLANEGGSSMSVSPISMVNAVPSLSHLTLQSQQISAPRPTPADSESANSQGE